MSSMVPYTRRPSNGWLLSPFGGFDAFDDAFNALTQSADLGFKMDVEDAGDHYEITSALPGVDKDDIDVELKEGVLTISVEKHESEEHKAKNWLQKETSEWKATRSFYLKDAAVEGISAKLDAGILSISVPKEVEKSNVTKVSID